MKREPIAATVRITSLTDQDAAKSLVKSMQNGEFAASSLGSQVTPQGYRVVSPEEWLDTLKTDPHTVRTVPTSHPERRLDDVRRMLASGTWKQAVAAMRGKGDK